MTSEVDLVDRLARAQLAMAATHVDVLLLSVGRDLLYLTGYEAPLLERLTMAVIPKHGSATMFVPELEAPKVPYHPDVFDVRPWGETADPVALVAAAAGEARVAAIGDQTWAAFLLALQERMPRTRFVSAGPVSSSLRLYKSDAEVALLRAAGSAADKVALRLEETRFAGRTEADLAADVSSMLIEEGHHAAWTPIVASGPNGASPHHQAGQRAIAEHDAVVIDFGGTLGGYHSDTTRMFYVGDPGREVLDVHELVRAAQEAGVTAAVAGARAGDVDRAARTVISEAGYGEFFIHRTGHGIGLDMHEEPYIVAGNEALLAKGMAFSVEPGVYLPGKFGVRIEDVVALVESGAERLNNSPRSPVIVG